MIKDRYFSDEEFEKKELNKGFWGIIILLPTLVFSFWGLSYMIYADYEIKPIYVFIYTYFKYSVFILIGLLIYNKLTKLFFKDKLIVSIGVIILMLTLILFLLSAIFAYRGENKNLVIDTVFLSSLGLFIIYFIIYFFRYKKRAEQGRANYIKQLEKRNFIIDNTTEVVDDLYFRIKNKALEAKLNILAIFIKAFTPAIVGLTVFIGWEYVKDGETDPSIFIVAFVGIFSCAYFGSLIALGVIKLINLNIIEKQTGRKIYSGLYPETIERLKKEALEEEQKREEQIKEMEKSKVK